MFKMSVNKKRNVVVEMDETTFEALIQTVKMACGDNIPESFTPEKQDAIYEVDRIIHEMFYADREVPV